MAPRHQSPFSKAGPRRGPLVVVAETGTECYALDAALRTSGIRIAPAAGVDAGTGARAAARVRAGRAARVRAGGVAGVVRMAAGGILHLPRGEIGDGTPPQFEPRPLAALVPASRLIGCRLGDFHEWSPRFGGSGAAAGGRPRKGGGSSKVPGPRKCSPAPSQPLTIVPEAAKCQETPILTHPEARRGGGSSAEEGEAGRAGGGD